MSLPSTPMDVTSSFPVALYATSDKSSFAYVSAKDRWPTIVTGALDDIHRTSLACIDDSKAKEGKTIVAGLATLKYEIQHDRHVTPLRDDGESDIAEYNKELEVLGPRKWFNVPWLFAECYLYRRIHTFFSLSTHWRNHDVFSRQKIQTFRSSRSAVSELAARYRTLVAEIESNSRPQAQTGAAEQILFIEMCEICLWGNATDLSLLTSLTYADIQKLQGADARKKAEQNILVNDLSTAFNCLKAAQISGKKDRRIDIVLDNAGFELFVDLILAGYLLASGLATQIILHPKNIPWFVSDVTPADFASLLSALARPEHFFGSPAEDEHDQSSVSPLSSQESEDLAALFQHWTQLYADGQLILRPNAFWTSPYSYWHLPTRAPDLFADLKEAEVVIFKGDLNYRKLTADAMWPTTIPFEEAIGPLGRGSGMRLLALRTCKADTVVGLGEGVDERLRRGDGTGNEEESSPRREWAWSGKWAVVQFCDGKTQKE